MKKLQLNKETIARLTNPERIMGGDAICTFSLDSVGNWRPTCDGATCNDTCHTCQTCNGPNHVCHTGEPCYVIN